MPQWLCSQLMGAFLKKDRKQIQLLNDCWFFYRTKRRPKDDSASKLNTEY